jgi:mannose-6-phosphate isomerase-like protein (cupin superfamily)
MVHNTIQSALSRLLALSHFRRKRKPIPIPHVIATDSLCPTKSECFPNTTCGKVSWYTLLSSPTTTTDSLTLGIATLPAKQGYLALHRHRQAEIYYILKGKGRMHIGSNMYQVGKGDVIYVPGGEEHGIWNDIGHFTDGEVKVSERQEGKVSGEELRWLYVFAADGFGEIKYRFS